MKFSTQQNKKFYFASDLHLSMQPNAASRERESRFVNWLNSIKTDAQAVFLLGDMFDFWFEYKHVVPRGFVRFLGTLAQMVDEGIQVFYFAGNHDQWLKDYFPTELGIPVFMQPEEISIDEKRFLLGHGHLLPTTKPMAKFLQKCFASKFLRFLYGCMHPFFGISIGKNWTHRHRSRYGVRNENVKLENDEIYRFVSKTVSENPFDYFIFGHSHKAVEMALSEQSKYFNTGEWLETCSYVEYDGKRASLKHYSEKNC